MIRSRIHPLQRAFGRLALLALATGGGVAVHAAPPASAPPAGAPPRKTFTSA